MKNMIDIIATIRRDRDRLDNKHQIIELTQRLLDNGINCLRFNVSKWRTEKEMEMLIYDIENIRTTFANQDLRILMDIPYPGDKPRIMLPKDKLIHVKAGKSIVLKSGTTFDVHDSDDSVCINVENIGAKLEKGQIVYYSDGIGGFRISEILDDTSVLLVAENDILLEDRKSLIFGKRIVNEDRSKLFINLIESIKPDIVALSFIENENDLSNFRQHFKNIDFKIMSKIETNIGVQNIQSIVENSDMIMIGRGDLGLHMDITKLAFVQEKVVEVSKNFNKPVYIATDILVSLVNRFVPSRADINDLTSILRTGLNGIVFTYNIVRIKKIAKARELVNDIHKEINSNIS